MKRISSAWCSWLSCRASRKPTTVLRLRSSLFALCVELLHSGLVPGGVEYTPYALNYHSSGLVYGYGICDYGGGYYVCPRPGAPPSTRVTHRLRCTVLSRVARRAAATHKTRPARRGRRMAWASSASTSTPRV